MFPKTELQLELESFLGRRLKHPLEFASELDLSSRGAQFSKRCNSSISHRKTTAGFSAIP
jgi:hypothetical protein